METRCTEVATPRIDLRCPLTRKIMAKISIAGAWPQELRTWLWCKGCHREHEVSGGDIEEARRAHDARGFHDT